ncbi:MAG: protein translocase subunit SecD [Puniceicoccales bacterium]|jgi:SecD/SecF fusion protein|nr:protein translocase subunit SecD [Puniceicoccales bacterium]
MRGRTLPRGILLSLAVILIAACNIFPVHDRPFDAHIVKCVTGNRDAFAAVMRRANDRVETGKSRSLYAAMMDVADEENLDLSQFFKNRNAAAIKNLREKNKAILNGILLSSRGKIRQGLDLKGGVSFVLKVDDAKFKDLTAAEKTEQLRKAIDIIGQRIDGLGVAEPLLRIFGDSGVEVQLPGISMKDNPEIVHAIKKPAKLEFRLLHPSITPQSKAERAPIGYEILHFVGDDAASSRKPEYAFVKKIPEMSGGAVKRASVTVGQFGDYEIALAMTDDGAKHFEKVTAANVGQQLGIVLDGELYSAPVIRCAISNGYASISGNFSQRGAIELANVLNNPLEVALKLVELNEIGPSLAEDVRTSSLIASVAGAAVVIIFMLAYYLTAGVVSLIAVVANVAIVIGTLSAIGATLTLPGIAALVLTIGMAVDANILIFERMREELSAGKPLSVALSDGHRKAFATILDANLTTLLTALILIHFGSGQIKGFGVTLAIGIFSTMFCALVLGKALLEFLVNTCSIKKLLPDFSINVRAFNFLGCAKCAAWIYAIVGVACIAIVAARSTKIYGIDFTGGDEITVKLNRKIHSGEISKLAAQNNMGEVVAIYQKSADNASEMLRVQTEEGKGNAFFRCLENHFKDARPSLVKAVEIGASAGGGVKMNAIISVALSMVCIMLYVAFRFEVGYGIGAVVSTLLDVLMTILIYLACGHQISAPMVASILMVVGYSINDTIIVFDRIREELKANVGKPLDAVINLSIGRTLARTILTSASTFLAAMALCWLGAGVVVDFALVFLIGVVVGTFSSIFVASPIFFLWHRGRRAAIAGSSQPVT